MPDTERKPSRPHLLRSAAAGAVAVAGLIIAEFGQLRERPGDPATAREVTLALAGAGVLLLAGIGVVRTLASAVRASMEQHVGAARTAPVSLIVSVAGYALLVITVLTSLDVAHVLQGLLLGGAVTGVAVGIAAQQTLGNFFAGLILMIVRPFAVGDYVILKATLGEYEGTVTSIGFFYVDLITKRGALALPNAVVLASAVGPGARSTDPEETPDEEEKKRKKGAPDPSAKPRKRRSP